MGAIHSSDAEASQSMAIVGAMIIAPSLFFAVSLTAQPAPGAVADERTPVSIPARTAFAEPDPHAMRRHEDGSVSHWSGSLSWFGDLANTGSLAVRVLLEEDGAPSVLRLTVAPQPGGQARGPRTDHAQSFEARSGGGGDALTFGPFEISSRGYHRLTLTLAADADADAGPALRALVLSGAAAEGCHFSPVERRNAASVHLGYPVPAGASDDVEWFYCEVTPKTDPLWTYYEATGWHRGYFGCQVNSPTERRLIFSVWDAGDEAISRGKVAAENRVQLLAKGDAVDAGDFGNEGTGGHSHLVYDWQLGETLRFLLHAEAEGTFTTYTGWFYFPEREEWGLIASFRAPRDGQLPHGLYSFNENFSGANGQLRRVCEFHNQWVRTTAGEWLALEEARFTHDGHGKEQRLDRSAGVHGDRFYLANGGFVVDGDPSAVTLAYETMRRAPSAQSHPSDEELPVLPD